MTALDIFRRYQKAGDEISRLEEKIQRREALVMGCTARPLTPDSGGHGGNSDASMRLLDYVANKEELEASLRKKQQSAEADRACCIYLAEMLAPNHADVMVKIYLESKTLKAAAEEMAYSMTHVKRLRKEAEDICKNTEITYWDGKHVPITAIRDSFK